MTFSFLRPVFKTLFWLVLFTATLTGQEMVADVNADTRDGFRGGFRTNGEEGVFIVFDQEQGTELYKVPGPDQEPVRFFDEIPGFFFEVTYANLIDSLYFFGKGSLRITDQLFRASLSSGAVEELDLNGASRGVVGKIGEQVIILAQRSDSVMLFANPEEGERPDLLVHIPDTELEFRSADVEIASNDSLLFFVAGNFASGHSIWRSNGTPAGTYPIFFPPGSTSDIIELQIYQNRLYFSTSSSGVISDRLYRTSENGDDTEIVNIETENGRPVAPRNLQVYNDSLWFSGTADWSTQLFATAGDSVVIIRQISESSSSPRGMKVHGGKLYWGYNSRLSGGDLDNNEVHILSNLASGEVLNAYGLTSMVTTNDDRLFLRGSTASTGQELWVFDSGSLVPKLVEDITPGPVNAEPGALTAFGNYVYFGARGGCLGYELFNANRHGAENVLEANDDGADAYPDDMFAHNGLLYFSAETGLTGREIFVSDGTGAGTQLTRDVTPGRAGETNLFSVALGDYVYHTTRPYFSISDSRRGFFRTDGTPEGTIDLYPQESTVGFSSPIVFKGEIFVVAEHNNQTYLLAHDPTEERVDTIVRYFNPQYYLYPEIIVLDDERMIISAWSPEGQLAFISDGTTAGTRPVPELLGCRVTPGWKYQNSVVFPKTVAGGEVLYRSDGTATGTYALSDVDQPFSYILNQTVYATINDTLYFIAAADGKFRLYGSDGSPGNYFEIPTEDGTSIWEGKRIEHIDGTIYIAANGATQTPALYRTNADKTLLVKVSDVYVGPLANVPRAMRAHDGYLFFNGYTEEFGEELYRSDGTEEGTVRVTDINPGSGFGRPLNLYSFGESLYFSASDGEFGAELWRYNPDNEMFGTDPFAGAVCPVLPTSIASADAEEQFRVFPNPAEESLRIDFAGEEAVRVTISSSDGREVLRVGAYRSGSLLPLPDLPSGLYIISMQSPGSNTVRSQKLVVSR